MHWCTFELKLTSDYIRYFIQILLPLSLTLSFLLIQSKDKVQEKSLICSHIDGIRNLFEAHSIQIQCTVHEK